MNIIQQLREMISGDVYRVLYYPDTGLVVLLNMSLSQLSTSRIDTSSIDNLSDIGRMVTSGLQLEITVTKDYAFARVLQTAWLSDDGNFVRTPKYE